MKLVWSQDPKHRNRGEFSHWLRRLETTAVRQPERIRPGFGAGPESGHGGVLGTRLPTLSGGGKEMQGEVQFKWPRQTGGSEFTFNPTTRLPPGGRHLLKI